MKFLITGLSVLVALATVTVEAQEAYTYNVSASQQARVDRARLRRNALVCAQRRLPANCTQAQVCSASSPAITPCNAANVAAADAEIYPDSTVGRQAFLLREIIVPGLRGMASVDASEDVFQMCAWWQAASLSQKNTQCAAYGLTSGCSLCP